MNILLIRHLECEKNLTNKFSTYESIEPLTSKGLADGHFLATKLFNFCANQKILPKCIYSADSIRAKQTSAFLANKFCCDIKILNNLQSIHSAYEGLTPEEVYRLDPNYMMKLDLYRNGVFNSYNFSERERFEKLVDFERRTNEIIENILLNDNHSLKILVLHRSPITSFLINIARRFHQYPMDFFGFIPLDLGNISWVYLNNEENIGQIKCINTPAERIEHYINFKIM